MLRYDNVTQRLVQSMDVRMRRQELLTSNIANADTPTYVPTDLEFEGFLKSAEEADDADTKRVLPAPVSATPNKGDLEVIRRTNELRADGTVPLDGNLVNRDEEIGKAAENMARYNTALELMNRKVAVMRYAIESN
ncbi:MAG: flagellar basal body rod protein FlgB [Myxococcota bacterium]|nr:flagellar basal body rod protein FlgB [Myxococcota bacterium]